jgi:hypothetical protein
MRVPPAVVLAASALALVACDDYPSGTNSSKPGGGHGCGLPVAKTDAGRRYLRADCIWRERCGYIPAGEVDSCVEIMSYYGDFLDERLNDPLLVYDPGAMACCVADLASFPCVDEAEPPSCARVVRGTVPVGGACEFDFHCHGGECLEGTCEVLPDLGEPCLDMCTEGNACSWEDFEDGVCVPLADEGESCVPYGRQCVPELVCDYDWRGDDHIGVCRPPAGEGERCSWELPCASAELYCALDDPEGYSGTCTRRAGIGQPCSYLWDDQWGGCVVGLACDARDWDSLGTCVVPPGEGETCFDRNTCAFPLTCFPDDICRRALFHGEPCGEHPELCLYGECIAGVCDWSFEEE